MQIKRRSFFKNPQLDLPWFEHWVTEVERLNGKKYERLCVDTVLGKTCVWGLNTHHEEAPTLVIFPGARTSPLFWDLDNGLDHLGGIFRIFMVETNGLPNNSDGNTPDIRSNGYGAWASELFDKLGIHSAFVAGASFGGLVAMKLSLAAPEKVNAIFLLNPGCLQPFSLSLRNLYYNLLPIVSPSEKNVRKFLDEAVFCKPTHTLSPRAEELLVNYEVGALTRYKDNTQKPYDMDNELRQVTSEVYLFEGDHDLLFPYKRSVRNAQEKIGNLKEVVIFENVGHGIETYDKAIAAIGQRIRARWSQ